MEENKIIKNPITMVDPENCMYLLLKVSIPAENDEVIRSWSIFENRKDAYEFIKTDLEENEEYVIDLTESFILPAFLKLDEATPIKSFVDACKSVYNDDFDFESFIVNK